MGFDLTPHGDAALLAAVALSKREGGLSIGVVHVVTQQALDKTGGLSAEEKQRAAVESLYPRIWKRVDELTGELEETPDIDVIVRVAAVHLARAEEHTARALLETAGDCGAKRIVLGRRGRPDSVAEHLAPAGATETIDGVSGGPFVVRLPD